MEALVPHDEGDQQLVVVAVGSRSARAERSAALAWSWCRLSASTPASMIRWPSGRGESPRCCPRSHRAPTGGAAPRCRGRLRRRPPAPPAPRPAAPGAPRPGWAASRGSGRRPGRWPRPPGRGPDSGKPQPAPSTGTWMGCNTVWMRLSSSSPTLEAVPAVHDGVVVDEPLDLHQAAAGSAADAHPRPAIPGRHQRRGTERRRAGARRGRAGWRPAGLRSRAAGRPGRRSGRGRRRRAG
jgi:hypothetical protein